MAGGAPVSRRFGGRRAGIFISYRRKDTAPYAGRIRDHLVAAFPGVEIFMDIDGIAPGDDFERVIDQKLDRCRVAVALIGPQWLVLDQQSGAHRPAPYVVREVATALRRGIRVIPVLVGDAQLPRQRDLPPELAALLQRNALKLDDDHFLSDLNQLLVTLRAELPARRRMRLWVGVAAAMLAVAALAVVASTWLLDKRLAREPEATQALMLQEVVQPSASAALQPGSGVVRVAADPVIAAPVIAAPVIAAPVATAGPAPGGAAFAVSQRTAAPIGGAERVSTRPAGSPPPPTEAACKHSLELFKDNRLREACPLVLECNAGKANTVGVLLAVADCHLEQGSTVSAIASYCSAQRQALAAPAPTEGAAQRSREQAEYAARRLQKLGHSGC